MYIREYDFTEFTGKNFFEMKLAGIQPDFGYISDTKRADFIEFCIKYGFIAYRDRDIHDKALFYNVKIPFRYLAMFNYEHRPVVMTDDCMVLIYPDSRMVRSKGKL